ncbi:fimbria/pilus outer membrane usher protein [Edaphovirga cremea]|uniref:fimbria/pilus outer membrane usher protein n=1 Tax=Edaphovirga cremea TaxID=2267246 RepID=UPI003CCC6911
MNGCRILTPLRAAMVLGVLNANLALADGLPPPPTAASMPDTLLYLELVINGKPSGNVLPVAFRGGHYYLTPDQLIAAGVPLRQPGDKPVAVDQIDKLDVSYNGESQQLMISLPGDWLPEQHFNTLRPGDFLPAQSSLGFLFNYDVYANNTPHSQQTGYVSSWTEQRLFGSYGALNNSGVYRREIGNSGDIDEENRYIRYDTQWLYNDDRTMMRYTAGDLITGSLPWSSSVRVGGIQLSRNFATRPDLITYPLPQFVGQAAVPSTVDLYINSFKTSSNNVNPGPFTLDSIPFINGSGQATVVTTDALGRQVSTTVPFYVASELLRPGLTDYSVSIGALRQDYGISSANYGQLAGSGIIRHGITDWLTLEGRAEGAPSLAVTGAGVGLRLGEYGVLNAALSGSYSQDDAFDASTSLMKTYNPADPFGSATPPEPLDNNVPPKGGNGDQTATGYTYSNRLFSISAQRILRSDDYADLSNYKTNYRLSRRSDQLTGSVGLGDYGTLGSGYFDVRDGVGTRTQLINLTYSKSLWRNISFYAAMNREIGGDGYSAQLMLSIPFANWGTTSLSASQDTDNNWTQRATYSRAAPTDGGLGWNLAYADGRDPGSEYQQADVIWRAPAFETRGGVYGGQGNYTRWGELTGSLVVMDSHLYATNQVNDAFALISTNGYADIPVSYENQLIGKTDSRGYLLVPTVTSYYHAKFEIDPLNLPADVNTPTVERTLAIRQNSGLLVEFPVKQLSSATVILVDGQGTPLPKGSPVTVNSSDQTSYVGWDGIAWLEQVSKENRLTVTRADDGSRCHAQFVLAHPQGRQNVGPLVCVP